VNALQVTKGGEGVGTALLEAALQQSRASGATLVGLAVEPENTRTIKLYRRFGVVEWPHRTDVDKWDEHDGAAPHPRG
jgi:GNAT superfamily N-acetyltransferase